MIDRRWKTRSHNIREISPPYLNNWPNIQGQTSLNIGWSKSRAPGGTLLHIWTLLLSTLGLDLKRIVCWRNLNLFCNQMVHSHKVVIEANCWWNKRAKWICYINEDYLNLPNLVQLRYICFALKLSEVCLCICFLVVCLYEDTENWINI